MSQLRIMIAIPSYKGFNANSNTMSLIDLVTAQTDPAIQWLRAFSRSCPVLPRVRNSLVAKAMAAECSHILFIDDDIEFRPADVFRMIGHDVGVIAAVPQKRNGKWDDPAKMAVSPEGMKINMAAGIGIPPEPKAPMALTLIKTQVFRDIAELKDENGKDLCPRFIYPLCTEEEHEYLRMYFGYETNPCPEGTLEYDLGVKMGWAPEDIVSEDGEDHYFCRRAHIAGHEIFIDLNAELIHFEGNVGHDYSLKKMLSSSDVAFKNVDGEETAKPVEGLLSIMMPTRGRPEIAKRAIKSLLETSSTPIEIVVGLDKDDETALKLMNDLVFDYEPRVRFVLGDRAPTLGVLWNRLFDETQGAIIGMMTDDCVIAEHGWDIKTRQSLSLLNKNAIGLAFPKDPHHPNFGTQFFMTRETAQIIQSVQGVLFEPWYPFWFNDTALNEIGNIAGCLVQMPWSVLIPEGRGTTTSLVNEDVPFWTTFFNHTRPMRLDAAEALIVRVNGGPVDQDEMNRRAERCAQGVAHLLAPGKQWNASSGEPGERYLKAKAEAEAFMNPELADA